MEFTNEEIELIKKAENPVKVSRATRQKALVAQLKFRPGHTYDE